MTRTSTYIPPTAVSIDRRLFAILLLQSFRYCLGRMTYAVSDCVENLTQYWDYLPPAWQQQIHGDINRAIDCGNAGMGMDARQWKKILKLTVRDDPK